MDWEDNNELLCELAADYIEAIAGPDLLTKVPYDILNHVLFSGCEHCLRKLVEVRQSLPKSMLIDSVVDSEDPDDRRKIIVLSRHLKLVGKHIDCRTAKPFLPLLADLQLKLTVPTPITVHIDNCPHCKEDLKILCSLKLEPNQLNILYGFYSERPFESSDECAEVEEYLGAIARMEFIAVTPNALKHVSLCKSCSSRIYNERLSVANAIPISERPTDLPCDAINEYSLFTYTLPYGHDPLTDEHVKFRAALVSHITKCPVCLEKMRQLHNTLYMTLL